MQRFKLTIAYDGTDYNGWQIQPGCRTIQGELENALSRFTGDHPKVHGSGRTDQGVHAVGQVAHVDLACGISCSDIRKALNAILVDDIRVLRVARAPHDFHARRCAVGKEYRYFIWNGEIMPPMIRRYRHHVRSPLDVDAMRSAASALAGARDFAAFTANPNRPVESTIRHLKSLTVSRSGREVVIAAKSDGFLYKMVRSIVGFLVRVGDGSIDPLETEGILKSRIRTATVPTAPAKGLFLWRVWYR